jgi:hypothetical protein
VIAIARCGVALGLVGCGVVAWVLLVPAMMTTATFLLLNALLLGMFGVGVASAAKGLPTHSIAQVLHDTEQQGRVRGHGRR